MGPLVKGLIAAYNAKLIEMDEYDRWIIENLLSPEDALKSFGWLV